MHKASELKREPPREADSCIIWLHGLGASGHDFDPVIQYLGLPPSLQLRFVFPHAPPQAVTVNGGMIMPAWFDIYSIDIDRRIDESGLRRSADRIRRRVEEELSRGIPAERILLAGFSQGGAVAYEVALSFPQRLGGLLALSSYFATADSIQCSEANQDLPIEIHHGLQDDVVPELLAQKSLEILRGQGRDPRYRSYSMAHELCAAQIRDIGDWIQRCLLS